MLGFDHPKVSEPVSIAYRSGPRVGSPDSVPYVLGFDHPKVSKPVSIAYPSGLRVGSPDSASYVLGFDHPKVSELPDALAGSFYESVPFRLR